MSDKQYQKEKEIGIFNKHIKGKFVYIHSIFPDIIQYYYLIGERIISYIKYVQDEKQRTQQ